MERTSTSLSNFWDSCVIISYIHQSQADFLGDMQTMLDEARSQKRKIWYSTLFYAELRPSQLQGDRFESIDDLVREMEAVMFPVAPIPDIMRMAARLRDRTFLPEKPQATEKPKILPTPDAIQLATALHVKDVLQVHDLEFHTFDDGKGKSQGDRGVSLLRLEDYCSNHMSDPDISAACRLPRLRPRLSDRRML